ncbi:hypothetical protein E2C01_053781 [Portunus trituberculatus]|uniref:Uncharacterized protein n=1 Tax=Portunus trituberculatus TaxID=210409 RepID=A0A5B7GQ88_PORTR|nr:hypothetical protein [Portunus trituberculatus]
MRVQGRPGVVLSGDPPAAQGPCQVQAKPPINPAQRRLFEDYITISDSECYLEAHEGSAGGGSARRRQCLPRQGRLLQPAINTLGFLIKLTGNNAAGNVLIRFMHCGG